MPSAGFARKLRSIVNRWQLRVVNQLALRPRRARVGAGVNLLLINRIQILQLLGNLDTSIFEDEEEKGLLMNFP